MQIQMRKQLEGKKRLFFVGQWMEREERKASRRTPRGQPSLRTQLWPRTPSRQQGALEHRRQRRTLSSRPGSTGALSPSRPLKPASRPPGITRSPLRRQRWSASRRTLGSVL